MKKSLTLLFVVLLTTTLWAQTPQKMSYQAVIRNSNDALVTNTQIGMEINIREGSITGNIVYTEMQTPTTNNNGLVTIEIGGSPGFDTINWGENTYYIETRTAIVPPLTNYTITGTSQLLSVPYALHAKTAETIIQGSNNVSVSGNGTSEEPFQIGLQNMSNSGFISGTFLNSGSSTEIILSSTNINLLNNYGLYCTGDISLTFDFPSIFIDTCDLCVYGITNIIFQLCYNGSCREIPLKHFLIDNHAKINLPIYSVFPISGNNHIITLKLISNNSKCKVHQYECLNDLFFDVTIEPHIVWYELNY